VIVAARFTTAAIVAGALAMPLAAVAAGVEDTIARVKRSVVAIGTFERTRSPPFQFRGTAFAVGDGTQVVTNAHVLPVTLDAAKRETIAILLPAPPREGSSEPQVQVRAARSVATDHEHDLAVLSIEGGPLPALPLGDSNRVREGQTAYFTGFPIGAVLGPHPATHRALVAAVTPIAIPQPTSGSLDAATVKRIASGPFPVFQLDGTAYPGNSGSPLYDGETGAVLGVLNMVLVKSTKESALTQPSGVAYAVPAEHLRALLAKVR
jgi:S1-C subfamily serine protease